MYETQSDENIYTSQTVFDDMDEGTKMSGIQLDEYYLDSHERIIRQKEAMPDPGPNDEHVFAFLSQPENYEAMVKASQRIRKVTYRIVKEFQNDLIEKLKIAFEAKGSRWKVDSGSMYNGYSFQIFVYHHYWCVPPLDWVIAIAATDSSNLFEPSIGIAINTDTKVYDSVAIKKDLNKLEIPPTYKLNDEDPFWSIHKPLHFSTRNYEDIQRILPENRAAIVSQVVKEFVMLAEHIENEVETIMANNLNR